MTAFCQRALTNFIIYLMEAQWKAPVAVGHLSRLTMISLGPSLVKFELCFDEHVR